MNHDTVRDHRVTAGVRLGRVAGIDVRVDASLLIVFVLVTFSLGAGAIPRLHPDWPPMTTWTVALAAAVLFFASILAHELSHALVGRAHGIPIRRITLFVFGGMAHMEAEPESPKAELWMALVGPVTSFAIGLIATFFGTLLVGPLDAFADRPEAMARAMGPGATLLLWLGPTNILLGLFNLVPGFPLDGGRVLRALLWWATGDLEGATRWASGLGRAVGILLTATGVAMAFGIRVPFFGTGLGGGLWLILLGWFLGNAARASYELLLVRRRLAGVPVTHVMRTGLDTVTPTMPLAEFVREHVMQSDQLTFPVVEDDELVGEICARDVRQIPYEQWDVVTVSDVMTKADSVATVDVSAGASEALERLTTGTVDQLPVVDHGHVRGFVRRQDLLKWLSLRPQSNG